MIPIFANNYSPNFSTNKRNIKNIKFIIIHYTGMKSEIKAINRLTDDKSKVSCHYFIKKNGQIICMVPENYIAWHAGVSSWKKIKRLNNYSIGIEIQNSGNISGLPNYKKIQINSLIKLCKFLKKKYNILPQNILGHSDIAYERKQDPGAKFPWHLLAKKNLSIWYKGNIKKLNKLRNIKIKKKQNIEFFKNLKKIGYKTASNKKLRKLLIIAFQTKFRKEQINGKIDMECLMISKKLNNT